MNIWIFWIAAGRAWVWIAPRAVCSATLAARDGRARIDYAAGYLARLPLSLLAPQQLLTRIRHNLRPGGLFFMVNHGAGEATLAERLCIAAKLRRVAQWEGTGCLSAHRMLPPVLSWWQPEVPTENGGKARREGRDP